MVLYNFCILPVISDRSCEYCCDMHLNKPSIYLVFQRPTC